MAVAVATLVGVALGTGAHVAVGATAPPPTEPIARVAGATLERVDHDEVFDGSLLLVEASGCGEDRQATATVIDSPSGPLVLTNAHVVRGAGSVVLHAGDVAVTATVVGSISDRDAAVLRIDDEVVADLQADGAAWSERQVGGASRVGDQLTVAGYPAGSAVAHLGVVTSIEPRRAFGGTTEVLVVDAAAAPGVSGGAVLDERGAVVALVAARDPGTGSTVAYPIADLLERPIGAVPGC
jgi:S1-C subfamily serine protease